MMNLLIADDVGQVKVVTITPSIDTTQKSSALPSIWSFYEPSPTITTISLLPLPLTPSGPSPSLQQPYGQVIALLRTPSTLSFSTFIPRKVKVAELNGNARLPDNLWTHDLPTDAELGKWLGLGLEGRLLYAWSEKGRIEVWGLPEGGVDAKSLEEIKAGEEPGWAFRGSGKVDVCGGMGVSVVKVQPYKGPGIPESITFAVGYTTESGEIEIFEASTSAWKKDSSKPINIALTPLFKSKPPRPDALKLPILGGVTSICWLPTPSASATVTTTATTATTHRYAKAKPLQQPRRLFLATGTPTGELRLYDTHISRRPIFREPLLPRGGAAALRGGLGTNVTRAVGGAGTGAVKCLEFINLPLFEEQKAKDNTSPLSFLFSDENAKCGIYTAKRLPSSSFASQYKGRATQLLPGAITGIVRGAALYHHANPESKANGILVSIVGLDRYLRIYRGSSSMGECGGVDNVEMISRAYMHTRGTGVVWVEGVDGGIWETEQGRREREKEERRREREREVEEVWEGIEGVEDLDRDSVMVDNDDEEDDEDEAESEEVSAGSEEEGNEDEDEGNEDSEVDGGEVSDESESEKEATPPPPPKSKKQTAAALKRKLVITPDISKRWKVKVGD
ncbi:hypothetical protein EV426DRAFT_46882 [Tirmania nivea]|nr:hypothetical protein EV426DRAFT_46882 [Tirmania nivea]